MRNLGTSLIAGAIVFLAIATVVVMVIALVAVAIRGPVVGDVCGKKYYPAHSRLRTITGTDSDGNTTTAYTTEHVEEQFVLLICFWKNDKQKSAYVYVPESIWQQAEIGCLFDENTYAVTCN